MDSHGETGSNARLQSEEATIFLECFIVDCEGKSSKWTAMERPEVMLAYNRRRLLYIPRMFHS